MPVGDCLGSDFVGAEELQLRERNAQGAASPSSPDHDLMDTVLGRCEACNSDLLTLAEWRDGPLFDALGLEREA